MWIMKHRFTAAVVILAAVATSVGVAIAQQGGPDVVSPNGIAMSEFKGYEGWRLIAPSVPSDGIKVILGNSVMMQAYHDDVITNGKGVPDGAVMAKIAWTARANPYLPGAMAPDTLRKVQFMVKDAKRFPDTDGWGYADFGYDIASGRFKAMGNGAGFAKTACHECHTRVRARDFVFTDFARR